MIDNYDSFTYMLRDYVMQCGEECMVVRNNEMGIDDLKKLPFDSILISPGPGTPTEAGITLSLIHIYLGCIWRYVWRGIHARAIPPV